MDNKITQQEAQDTKSENFLSKEVSFDLQKYAKDLFFTSIIAPQDKQITNESKNKSDDETR